MGSTQSQVFNHRYRYLLGSGIALLISAMPAGAAEGIRFRYGVMTRSLPVSSLRQLAETGQMTSTLQAYLRRADQDPQKVSKALTRPITVSPVQLDRLLNSPLGDPLLQELGEVIYPPSRQANRQALRAALIMDASEDGQITILDTLEHYPTNMVEVDGEQLVAAYQRYGPLIAKGKQFAPAIRAARPLLQAVAEDAGPILKEARPQHSGAFKGLSDMIRSLLK